ncbi:uncharacterized mitochondrial protein AtMg00810-like [Solanum stenotomum]|uniref:uncharacterized mitochondrial protein AtMg00810-like n=1 Tax=Solanum stenotomum TaxID=172797 RepID=UPI0020D04732|nr:uncharacterized mitochondrial protein AtMg00810-like [Solanum stenotomum]
MGTVRTIISVAASKDWSLFQMDAISRAHTTIIYSLSIVVLLIYVDDILLTRSSHRLINDAKQYLYSQFKVKDLGELKYFQWIDVLRSQHRILMNQRKYALEVILDVGLAGSKPVHTPLEPNIKLTSVEHDKCTGVQDDPLFKDMSRYQKPIGKLIYVTITRPYICFVVQLLSLFMQHPKQSHCMAALRVMRYVKGSPGLGIFLRKGPIDNLVVHCDSDWAACPNTRRSVTCFVLQLGTSLISWKSKKQQTVSCSSVEEEYRSMAAAVAEVIWMVGLLKDLCVEVSTLIQFYCDSKNPM